VNSRTSGSIQVDRRVQLSDSRRWPQLEEIRHSTGDRRSKIRHLKFSTGFAFSPGKRSNIQVLARQNSRATLAKRHTHRLPRPRSNYTRTSTGERDETLGLRRIGKATWIDTVSFPANGKKISIQKVRDLLIEGKVTSDLTSQHRVTKIGGWEYWNGGN